MSINPHKQLIQERFSAAKSVYVVLGPQQNPDTMASTLYFSQACKQLGKHTYVASLLGVQKDTEHLHYTDTVEKEVGNRNLVISLPLNNPDDVDKVSYNKSDNDTRFNLVIFPKYGAEPLDASKVEYSYTGAEADFVLVLGANSFQDLGHFYETEKSLFELENSVTIAGSVEDGFTNLVYVPSHGGSYVEAIDQLLSDLQVNVTDSNTASNCLEALYFATDSFRVNNIAPETFEAAATFSRRGGQRIAVEQSKQEDSNN